MGEINRIARGFLDLVRSQTGGRAPNEYTETLVPVLNFENFYLSERIDGAELTAANTADGAIRDLAVPDDQLWLLRSIETQWDYTGALPFNSQVAIWADRLAGDQEAGTVSRFPLAVQNMEFFTGQQNGKVTNQFVAVPLLPGTRIRFQQTALQSAGNPLIAYRVGFARLRAT